MTILTGRLEALAQQIEPGETMADIGTDHGFLPISLFERGRSPRVIMTDVSPKALSKAQTFGKDIPGLSEADFRCGDGLSPIKPAEVDVVVIAGMGGILMASILSADLEKTETFSKLVLQPRNHPEVLRHWLVTNGFDIASESLVREKRNLCEIIVAKPHAAGRQTAFEYDKGLPHWDIRWEVPPAYAGLKSPLATEYLQKKLERELRVKREVQKARTKEPDIQTQLDARIAYLKALCKERESNHAN